MKWAILLTQLFITSPIFFYLCYQVLVRVNASELMWFLFWCYIPINIFAATLWTIFFKERS